MQTKYNPDVLSCLANLSNDEVFTPPSLANAILDMLPQELFESTETTFLDPCCKSGVFLREIAKRLIKGLEKQIPDLQKRLNHIYTKQLFGIAITELTALLSRRSTYCSKHANGKYSICNAFKDDDGNIQYKRVEHTWENGRCAYCGASQSEYDRDKSLETHAYQFIHNPKELEKMKFDVIVGNPPYQLSTGGAQAQATPLYHKFIQQAKKLNPRFLTMIVPSRWFAGGMGLDEFRDEMLNDTRIRKLIDYPISSECFAGVEIKGGVCYFLWDRDNKGDCEIKTIQGNEVSIETRPLLEKGCDIFVRFNKAIPIIRKIQHNKEKTMDAFVSSIDPFKIPTNFTDYEQFPFPSSIKLYGNKFIGYVRKDQVKNNKELLPKYKVLISEAYGAGETYPHQILNKPFIAEPNSCSTFTYIIVSAFEDKKLAENCITYIKTKFFRFLVALRKNTQHAPAKVYQFVPLQDFNESWTDEKLYKKYGLTQEEIDFIESMIRPME